MDGCNFYVEKNVFHKSSFEICFIYISENETWWITKNITRITEIIEKKTGLYFKFMCETYKEKLYKWQQMQVKRSNVTDNGLKIKNKG